MRRQEWRPDRQRAVVGPKEPHGVSGRHWDGSSVCRSHRRDKSPQKLLFESHARGPGKGAVVSDNIEVRCARRRATAVDFGPSERLLEHRVPLVDPSRIEP